MLQHQVAVGKTATSLMIFVWRNMAGTITCVVRCEGKNEQGSYSGADLAMSLHRTIVDCYLSGGNVYDIVSDGAGDNTQCRQLQTLADIAYQARKSGDSAGAGGAAGGASWLDSTLDELELNLGKEAASLLQSDLNIELIDWQALPGTAAMDGAQAAPPVQDSFTVNPLTTWSDKDVDALKLPISFVHTHSRQEGKQFHVPHPIDPRLLLVYHTCNSHLMKGTRHLSPVETDDMPHQRCKAVMCV
jgi:hypothetical protein